MNLARVAVERNIKSVAYNKIKIKFPCLILSLRYNDNPEFLNIIHTQIYTNGKITKKTYDHRLVFLATL
jgi:hypothetical protein